MGAIKQEAALSTVVKQKVVQCTNSLHYLTGCEEFSHMRRFKEGFGRSVDDREKSDFLCITSVGRFMEETIQLLIRSWCCSVRSQDLEHY
ncbi:hypothetical protein Tco_1262049 [Tanacetum coccineum]